VRIVLLRAVVNFLFERLTQRQVSGLENIPARGPCVLIFNQLSNFDTPLIFTLMRRTDATGLVAANYREHPF
jgi:1-acyl-sn-glycerol-3-phosphate acyltransferase